MYIYFVRHGQREPQKKDIGLTKKGIEQASATGQYFVSKSIGVLVSGPSPRAQQTAQIIAKSLKLSYSIDVRLKERFDFEEYSEHSYNRFLKICKSATKKRNLILPNGTTSINVGKKVENLINTLRTHSARNVVLISHEGTISDYLRNVFPEEKLEIISNTFTQFFSLDECSITQVEINKNIKLIMLNSTSHLSVRLLTERSNRLSVTT